MKNSFLFFVVSQLVLIAFSFSASSQSIENVKAVFVEGKVTIMFDLTTSNTDLGFKIEVYGSHNNYSSAIKYVTGDVGENIKGGQAKRIIWDAKAELVTYKGEISFRVKGIPSTPSLVFKTPFEGGTVRRGKETSIQWVGGNQKQTVLLEVFRGSEKVETIAQGVSGSSYNWVVPKSYEKGAYSLRLSTPDRSINSGNFLVKAKVPLFFKVLPVAIVGLLAAFAGGGADGGEPAVADLPLAPSPN